MLPVFALILSVEDWQIKYTHLMEYNVTITSYYKQYSNISPFFLCVSF